MRTCVRTAIIGITVALTWCPVICATPSGGQGAVELLASLLEGDFDTHLQPAQLSRLHCTFEPLSMPSLAATALFARCQAGASTSADGLWAMSPDPESPSALVRIYRFRNVLHADQARPLDSLRIEDLEEVEGCQLQWRLTDEGLEAPTGSCQPLPVILAGETAQITMLRADRTGISADLEESSHEGPQTIELRRCRLFHGEVSVKPRTSPSGEPIVYRNLGLHDQGGLWALPEVVADHSGLAVELERDTTTSSPTLALSLVKLNAGAKIEVAVARASPEADRIGLALEWFEARFSADDWASPELRLLRRWMSGSFSSAAQAAAEPGFFDVHLHVVPIWSERQSAFWFYLEQATADALERPYRQRVYELRQISDNLFEISVYGIANALEHAGAWSNPNPLATIKPEDLADREGCTIVLRRRQDRFEGGTVGRLCASSVQGAVMPVSEVVISSQSFYSWDRGFGPEGQQVWGSEKHGYTLKRVEEGAAPTPLPSDTTEQSH